MEKKINVAELLKDCPQGMELDCALYEDVYFDGIIENSSFPIAVNIQCGGCAWTKHITLTNEGKLGNHPNAKCVIFPKGKTTWEGFIPPCPFKDGDIIADGYFNSICIFKGEGSIKGTVDYYCGINDSGELFVKDIKDRDEHFGEIEGYNFATEEEKQKLFDVIKANGYKWNEETKTLEKLFEPKFKVGDIVQDKDNYRVRIFDVSLEDELYEYESLTINGIGGISFIRQDDWELVPNKFDITTLKPFDKVLVRLTKDGVWNATFFSHYDKEVKWGCYPFVTTSSKSYSMCIPYENNEHLLGTTDDCTDFYKTWE